MNDLFPRTEARLEEWTRDPEVLGVLLVGSKSRGHADALSDDDLEVLLTDDAFARRTPAGCHEMLIEGEGDARALVYDALYMRRSDLAATDSPLDLDHWPYERARVLFDRDGATAGLVAARGAMPGTFRSARIRHAGLDGWIASRRAAKTLRRGSEVSARTIVHRGGRAMVRVVFALESRWVPLDHWLDAELATLADEAGVVPLLRETIVTGSVPALAEACERLGAAMVPHGLPADPAGRIERFLAWVHPSGAAERTVHAVG